MNDPVPASTAAHSALTEVCRTQSMRLDAARERIAELEAIVAARDAEIAAKDKTIAEQRALLARAKTSLAENFNDPAQGDRAEAVE